MDAKSCCAPSGSGNTTAAPALTRRASDDLRALVAASLIR